MRTDTALKRLFELLRAVADEKLSVEAFCSSFGTTFNIDLEKSAVEKDVLVELEKVFETVIWYSPYHEERAIVPNYLDETTVLASVQLALSRLGDGGVNVCRDNG